MQHVKKILWDSGPGAYTFYVPETTGNLDWRPVLQRRTTAGWRYFFVRTSCALNGRALTGVRSRTPVSFAPVRQPRLVPGHPDWRRGLGYATSKGVAMRPTISARPQQIQFPSLHPGDRVRSLHAGRVGAVVKVYADGSAAVCWDDGGPQPEGLAHERMPRALLEMIMQARSDRAEEAPSVSKIISDALRAAALAPTLSDALDAAGVALTDIANMARSEAPPAHPATVDTWAVESLCIARNTANETLRVLDRLACLFESIARLTRDTDDAVGELACIGREIIDAEIDRVDTVFTHLSHCELSTEVCHG